MIPRSHRSPFPSPCSLVFEALATLADLPPGTLLPVRTADGTPICLVNDRGAVRAVHDVCTHAEFAMHEGALQEDGTIECAWHGARFDCRTGAVRKPPAFDPLPVYEVRVEGETILVGPRKEAP